MREEKDILVAMTRFIVFFIALLIFGSLSQAQETTVINNRHFVKIDD